MSQSDWVENAAPTSSRLLKVRRKTCVVVDVGSSCTWNASTCWASQIETRISIPVHQKASKVVAWGGTCVTSSGLKHAHYILEATHHAILLLKLGPHPRIVNAWSNGHLRLIKGVATVEHLIEVVLEEIDAFASVHAHKCIILGA